MSGSRTGGGPGCGMAFHDIARLLERGSISGREAFRLLLEEKRGNGVKTDLSVVENGHVRPGKLRNGQAQEPLNGRTNCHVGTINIPASSVSKELNELIGLRKVKELIYEFEAFLWVQQRRRESGLKAEPQVLHMVFKGNPGTGKTTVAGIIGRMLKELGFLEKGHIVSVERADLVGEFIGHTAQKTREHIKKAVGGVLFIDEAYSLARGGEKDFGKEAIDTLVKGMEDHKNELVVILAGYHDEMEWFLRQNPGLRSRFPVHIDFPDYTVSELMMIIEHMLRERDYRLDPDARMRVLTWLKEPGMDRVISQGNARLIRNIVEKAIRRQAVRLKEGRCCKRDDMVTINLADIRQALLIQGDSVLGAYR